MTIHELLLAAAVGHHTNLDPKEEKLLDLLEEQSAKSLDLKSGNNEV